MTGLEMSSDMIASREAALFHTLDNPDRRHDAEGIVPIVGSPTADLGMPEAQIAPLRLTDEARHDSGTARHEARTSVLLEAQGLVHGARNVAYGPPIRDYTRTAGMVSAMLAHKLKEPLTAEDLICVMICVKLSRQQNAPKRDNAVDGAGYFECLQWVIDSRAGLE
jgi:hypothetical protein